MLRIRSWWLVTGATDLRCGMDRLLVQVQAAQGRVPAEGEAYVFANRGGTRMKLLACDRHGVWLAVRRLHQGRFVWPREGGAMWAMSAEQFAWLSMGVDWQRLSIGSIPDSIRV
jgi:transposase